MTSAVTWGRTVTNPVAYDDQTLSDVEAAVDPPTAASSPDEALRAMRRRESSSASSRSSKQIGFFGSIRQVSVGILAI